MLLQARCSAQRGVDPLELSFTCSRLSMSLQGAKRLLMCRWRSHAFLRVWANCKLMLLQARCSAQRGSTRWSSHLHGSRLSMSLQGAKRLLMCRWRSHAFLRV